jgi:RNase P subunit RPR2
MKRGELCYLAFVLSILILASFPSISESEENKAVLLSEETQQCIGCHASVTPGIVEDWKSSRHAEKTPSEALKEEPIRRRISASAVPEDLSKYAVGCFECHSRNTGRHKDSFEHMGFTINVIVTPDDCRTCHPVEVREYSWSKKAHARKNLLQNLVYHTLVNTVVGLKSYRNGVIVSDKPSQFTLNEVCLGCHGTKIEVEGLKEVNTSMGPVLVPDLKNWPNQGVGRENPDGSFGSCTSCHTRHRFSIKEARKPYTCAQCHAEPDVPAWYVYKVSKHGNIFSARHEEWNFDSVPWILGKDFKAPTCATCHNSLIVSPDGDVIAERTHDFGSRLYLRIFGLIYSHPQPRTGDTTIIRNKDGLPLPTAFSGEVAEKYLIGNKEQQKRLGIMKAICKGCHSTDWTDKHFIRFENTVKETDRMTLTATRLLQSAWDNKMADPSNPFDEAIEQRWIKQWLFFANTVRYASAMTGAYDYTGFNYGWWDLTNNLQEMKEMISTKDRNHGAGKK